MSADEDLAEGIAIVEESVRNDSTSTMWPQYARPLLAEIRRLQLSDARYQFLRADNAYLPEEEFCRGGEYLDRLCDHGIAILGKQK